MRINPETFDQKRDSKKRPMSLAAVARKAGVSERTLARIKKGEEMNPRTVAKIAEALDTSVVELCSASGGSERGGVDGMQIELVAARYQVPPELIERLAPVLFVAIAELALKQRKDRLENWWAKVEELQESQPKFNIESLAEMDAESGMRNLTDAYWEEMEQIEKHSLDGWADEHYDHFFSALFSVYDKFSFEGYLTKEKAPFVYGGYKFDGNFPDEKFPYPRESLKGLEGGSIWPEVFYETISDLAGSYIEFYDPFCEKKSITPIQHPISKMAEEKLLRESVPLSGMPIELRRDDKAFERAEWIASCGGKEEIPEVFYHWESVRRISEHQYYEDRARELSEELQGAVADERTAIEDELQEAKQKAVAWKALIMPDDEEWYAKWLAYWEAQEKASSEEEVE